MKFQLIAAGTMLASMQCAPAIAQDEDETLGGVIGDAEIIEDGEAKTVFDDTWIAVGVGLRVDTSYDGSDDYVIYPLPAATGRIKGVEFSPRGAGGALTLVEVDLSRNVEIGLGPVARLRSDRRRNIQDPVVEAAGKLRTAVEVGATAGITFKRVLNDYDRLSIGVDFLWDVKGAHSGMVIDPGISYRTPLSRGIIANISAGAQYGDSDFMDYYYSVSPAQSSASGLPLFQADKGWEKAGVSLGVGFDLDGNLENGGFVIGVLGGYSRMLGDSRRTPYTSLRGDADQFYGAAGVGYVF